MMTDPIADYLTKIRNAAMVKHPLVVISYSKIKESITKILLENNFVKDYRITHEGKYKQLEIDLKYIGGKSVISEISRTSKPGRRMYMNSKELKPIKQGYGISILTTSKGLFTDKTAREMKIGGEILCTIW